MENKEVLLELKNVSKFFRVPHIRIDTIKGLFLNIFRKIDHDDFVALSDVSLSVKKGEFVGIIGHNGAGKSTLLKIIAGVLRPDLGTVNVNGKIAPFLELGIGFNPELSGRDNIYLNASVLGMSLEKIDEKFDDIVAFSEIGNFIDQQVKNYSSGMRGRLAFAVSVFADSDILLMDEVLAVGDEAFKDKCIKVFENYKKLGKTVLLVTHSMATVRMYCDRAILLNKGTLTFEGSVDEVCDRYILDGMTEDQRKALKKKEAREKREVARKEEMKKGISNKDLVDIQFNLSEGRTDYSIGEEVALNISLDKINVKSKLSNIKIDFALYNEAGRLITLDQVSKIEENHSISKNFIIPNFLPSGLYFFATHASATIDGKHFSKAHYKKHSLFKIKNDKGKAQGPVIINFY